MIGGQGRYWRAVHIVIIVLIVAAVIGLVVWGAIAARKRREAIAAWAAAQGFTFERAHDASWDERWPFACLREGSDRYAYNVMRGERGGRAVTAFDYHYETYSTDSKGRRTTHHHRFSAVIVDGDVPLQPLSMRPEHFFDKIGEFFGIDDIDFESAEFSRRFHVKAKDKKWAFDVISPKTMEFLLGQPQFQMEMQGRSVIAWRSSCFAPPAFEQALGVIEGILERLPPFLVRELQEKQAMREGR